MLYIFQANYMYSKAHIKEITDSVRSVRLCIQQCQEQRQINEFVFKGEYRDF